MKVDLNIILNVVIGLALYNMILKSFALTVIKTIVNSKHVTEEKRILKMG